MKRSFKIISLLTLFLLLLVACQPQTVEVTRVVTETEQVEVTRVVTETITEEGETVEVTRIVEEVVEVTAVPEAKTVENDWPDVSWEEVLAEAEGQTVNWYYWGGSDNINRYVEEYLGGRLQDEFGITVNSVHINDTVEAVNKVLGEAEAGRREGGSVDLIWINGENFKTLRQADLLFGPYTESLPNAQEFLDLDSPFLQFDFGYPVEGYESPWTSGQFVLEYDSAVVPEPPTTVEGLVDWICENPGQFTYPAPPDFTGTAFLTHFFYHYTGGHEQWSGRWNDEKQALFDEKAPEVWAVLNEIEPCLWRAGQTYANSPTEMDELLANSEISMNMNYGITHASVQIAEGNYPETVRTFIFDTGTVANHSDVAIPFNSPNKAAALVTANLILDPESMLVKNDPNNDFKWGSLHPLDLANAPEDVQQMFNDLDLGPATIALSELHTQLPPLSAEMVPIFEAAWRENVLEQ